MARVKRGVGHPSLPPRASRRPLRRRATSATASSSALAHPDELGRREEEAGGSSSLAAGPQSSELAARGADGVDRAVVGQAAGRPAAGRPAPGDGVGAAVPSAADRRPGRAAGRRPRRNGARRSRTAAGRQLDALDRNARTAVGDGNRAGEGDGHRQGGVVRDLDQREAAAVGDGPDPVDRVAAWDPQPGLEDRGPVDASLADSGVVAGVVPAVVGRDVPVERGRTVPRLERPAGGHVGPPRRPITPVVAIARSYGVPGHGRRLSRCPSYTCRGSTSPCWSR